ncbi:MAG TPA: glycosyltransferase family 1 protein [Thermoanaerobaculia bacterium]|nr:glycosyltransferase family 1 protein [Thermoanaerobaculia bacterium]
MRIVQIAPRLPPPAEGVGSYALALAGALEGHGIATRFLASTEIPRKAEAVAAFLEGEKPDAVLLHYANYGYQSRGCPVWLVDGLDRWRDRGPGRRLVTFFHEVWASGPPWRSSFWLLPVQRRLAARLTRLSESLATSLEIYSGLLRPWARDVAVMPVFSTVGEPAAVPSLAERAHRIVVFGGEGVRRRAWGPFRHLLVEAVHALGAEEVCDVGAPVEVPASVGGAPVRRLGPLSGEEVSGLLLGSAAGFLAYPPDFLPKSTIFAAYCSHGTLPVCAWNRHPQDGPPYWRGSGDPQAVASAAREWYAGHSLARQAERFRALLAGESAGR